MLHAHPAVFFDRRLTLFTPLLSLSDTTVKMGFRKPSFGAHKHEKAADLKSHDREDREAIVVHSNIGSQSSLDKNEVFGDGDVNYRRYASRFRSSAA